MRNHAFIALASCGVARINHPVRGANGVPGEPQSVSVAKKPTPQLLRRRSRKPDEAVPPPSAAPSPAPPPLLPSRRLPR